MTSDIDLIKGLDNHWKFVGFENRPSLDEMLDMGVDAIIEAMNRFGMDLDRERLEWVINSNINNEYRFN